MSAYVRHTYPQRICLAENELNPPSPFFLSLAKNLLVPFQVRFEASRFAYTSLLDALAWRLSLCLLEALPDRRGSGVRPDSAIPFV